MDLPEIVFEPFNDEKDDWLAVDDEWGGSADVRARLTIRFDEDQESPVRLAEMLLAHWRKHGAGDFCVTGQLQITHDDDSLPPSAVKYDRLPTWLRYIVDVYRKTDARSMLDELGRLHRIIEAIESTEPDSCFTKEENRHRVVARSAQDNILGSRETLRERLSLAVDALRYCSEGGPLAHAKSVLALIEQAESDS